jgi:hypothetical protein
VEQIGAAESGTRLATGGGGGGGEAESDRVALACEVGRRPPARAGIFGFVARPAGAQWRSPPLVSTKRFRCIFRLIRCLFFLIQLTDERDINPSAARHFDFLNLEAASLPVESGSGASKCDIH